MNYVFSFHLLLSTIHTIHFQFQQMGRKTNVSEAMKKEKLRTLGKQAVVHILLI